MGQNKETAMIVLAIFLFTSVMNADRFGEFVGNMIVLTVVFGGPYYVYLLYEDYQKRL